MSTIGQPIVEKNLTLLEMMDKIEKLEKENQELRDLLHNTIENQNDKKEFLNNNYNDLQVADEDNFNLMAEEYSKYSF